VPALDVATCSFRVRFLIHTYIPPSEYSSAKNNKSLRKEKMQMREGRGTQEMADSIELFPNSYSTPFIRIK